MKLHEYRNHDHYVRSQKRADRRKSRRTSVRRSEVASIANWLRSRRIVWPRGICHGARNGEEVDWFSEEFPEGNIVGTDLFPREHPKVIQRNFHERREEDVGRFDFVYSNSLDHSHMPYKALQVWLEQLRPGGFLFLMWHPCQIGTRGGDCFGAHFHEYVEIVEKLGEVVDLLYQGRGLVDIVCQQKQR